MCFADRFPVGRCAVLMLRIAGETVNYSSKADGGPLPPQA